MPSNRESSKFSNQRSHVGLYGLIGGIAPFVMYEAITSFWGDQSALAMNYEFIGLAVANLIFILIFCLPSFRRTAYPNMIGLAGLIVNIVAMLLLLNQVYWTSLW